LCLSSWYCTLKPSYLHNPGKEPLVPWNTAHLIDRAAEKWGQREALVSMHQGHRFTFHQIKEQPGDRLGLWGPNSSQWYLTFLAAARAGLILVNINPAYQGAYRFKDVHNYGTPELVSQVQQLKHEIQPDEGCNLQFTSGTTGQAKASLLTHYSTINNMMFVGSRLHLSEKEHRICLQVPLFHCFGNVLGLLASLCYGSALVLPGPSFNIAESLRAIEEESCTLIYGTPTMFVDFIAKAKESNRKLNSLEMALVAGAPIDALINLLFVQILLGGYGMTETSPISFFTLPTDSNEKVTSTVGFIMEHIEAKVVDENGKMVPFGKPGELWVRGYGNMLCYWRDEARTKETIGEDRWLKTGDQFVLHEDGYGAVVGRIKDMIIRGGENIFPKEIEHFLERHPDILEAQVLGIPDARMGEEVCACIRLNKGSSITAENIKEYCKGKIAHFKIPRYIYFMSEFPKTHL
ncbi:hypothetical protein L9F63_010709, partial [Diploptera punctata]